MFSTCLICHRGLGANESIETFPVGRRLAFDERTGRLWVVCKSCGQWNLSPIEERWEAIETCERLYRESRVKAATDNIGLTTLSAGLDLIRIGKPLRPEFSAWRYGSRIVARRKKAALVAVGGAAVTAVASVAVVGAAVSAVAIAATLGSGFAVIQLGILAMDAIHEHTEYEREVAAVTGENGHRYTLRKKHLRTVSLEADANVNGWRLSLHHETGLLSLAGIQAQLTAAQVLAHMNKQGARKAVVETAAQQISDAGGAEEFIRNAIKLRDKRRRSGQLARDESLDSFGLRYDERLAVEMAMHEDAERVALESELGALEAAWREAEEIGHISDRMFDK